MSMVVIGAERWVGQGSDIQVNRDLAAEEVQALYVFRARLEEQEEIEVAACRHLPAR